MNVTVKLIHNKRREMDGWPMRCKIAELIILFDFDIDLELYALKSRNFLNPPKKLRHVM